MLKRMLVCAALLTLVAAPALAQPRGEVTAAVGFTFSDGVSFTNAVPAANGGIYSRADPKDSVSFTFGGGVYVTHAVEVEFLWNHQPTKLEVSGNGPTLSGDMSVDNYHGNFVFHAGEWDAKVRPFVYFGLGATTYGDAKFPTVTVNGVSKFSWAIGAGVKAYPSPHVGIRASARWVPTYIKTDGYGWWCDPFWGCVPVGNTQYSNQFELSGGVSFRFEPEPEPLEK